MENKEKNKSVKKLLKNFEIKNRKASFEYSKIESYTAGIVLYGSEIKSIRQGNASISEAYCYVNNEEVFIKNMHISALPHAVTPHDPIRERKLLLNRKEINKIDNHLKNQGITLIPTVLYSKKGLAKLEIIVAKGNKMYEKRENIKKKDIERELKREGF